MKWHHSLYWRISLGFVACLALLLLVQATLFVWVVSRSAQTIPNQPPDRFAQNVAFEVTQALERDPALDIAQYVRQEFAHDAQPFLLVVRDGPTVSVGGSFPEPVKRDARARFDALLNEPGALPLPERGFGRGDPNRFEPGPFGRGDPDGRGRSFDGRPFERGRGFGPGRGGPGRSFRPALIRANNQIAGLVVVPGPPAFTFVLARYATALGLVALATLIVGAILAAAVIFGPARKRLRSVEDAARRLGAGDLTARAPAAGDDEVAAVAAAFNTMADDLSARAGALAAADRTRRQLLADVSHELNTPVTAMRGYLETLRMDDMPLDEPTRMRYLAVIADETARLERLIGDLLDLARLDGGGGSLAMEDVSIDQLFARVVARHDRAAAAEGITFRSDVAPDARTLHGDRDRLEQALQNLAANAMRYAPSGSAITLGAHRHGADVELTVTDQGAGISADHLPHVFDRFYKADGSRAVRAKAGGSGLGLSIVKAIVEQHGGTVSVDSRPGRTSFGLRFPIGNSKH